MSTFLSRLLFALAAILFVGALLVTAPPAAHTGDADMHLPSSGQCESGCDTLTDICCTEVEE